MTDNIAKALRIAVAKTDRNPSEAQKESGNYAKGKLRLHGMTIAIENPKGAERSGVDKGGKTWAVKMPAHYGYVLGTEGKDGDHVDVYIGPDHESSKVFVVDQIDAGSGRFDEHKALLSYPSKSSALADYEKAFSDGKAKDRIGAVTEMSVDQFKSWLKSGSTKKPLGGGVYREGNSMTKKSTVQNALAVARRYASGGVVGYADGGSPDWDWRSDMDAPAPGFDIRRGEILPPYRGTPVLKEAQPGSVPTDREAAIEAVLNYGTLPAELTGVPAVVRGGKDFGRGIAEGDAKRVLSGVAEGALGALPVAGRAIPAIGAAVSSLPRAAGTTAALGAATVPLRASEATAEANASIAEYVNNDPDVKRLRAERDKIMAERVKVNQQHAKSGKETQRQALAPFNTQLDALDGTADTPGLIGQAEDRARKSFLSNAPFRTRHPGVADAMFYGGLGVGAFLPFANTIKSNLADRFVHQPAIAKQADAVERALSGGYKEPGTFGKLMGRKPERISPDKATFNRERDVLDEMLEARYGRQPSVLGNALTGTAVAMESRMLPEEIDTFSFDPGHPTRDAASKALTSPSYYLSNAVPSVIAGAAAGSIAGKAGDLLSKSELPAMSRAARAKNWDYDAKGPPPRMAEMPSIWESATSIPRAWFAGKSAEAKRIAAEEQRLALEGQTLRHSAELDAIESARRADQARRRMQLDQPEPGRRSTLRLSDQSEPKKKPSEPPRQKASTPSGKTKGKEPDTQGGGSDSKYVAYDPAGVHGRVSDKLLDDVLSGNWRPSSAEALVPEMTLELANRMQKARAKPVDAADLERMVMATRDAMDKNMKGINWDKVDATSLLKLKQAVRKTPGTLGLAGPVAGVGLFGAEAEDERADGGSVMPTVFLKTKHPAGHWQMRSTNGKFASGGAVSAALDTARRYANGGRVHVGPVVGATGGREDKLPVSVPAGSFVIPADVVGSLGQGNTEAGFARLEKMFGKPMPRKAAGGAVPIKISDGEFVISPEQVARVGGGDMDRGHRTLDALVLKLRDEHIKTLAALPPPSK